VALKTTSKPACVGDETVAANVKAATDLRGPREKKLRLADVKQMFVQMRDYA